MEVKKTQNGFELIDFTDFMDTPCSLQQSYAVMVDTDDAWNRPGSSGVLLGVNGNRMELTVAHVEELIKHLSEWVKTGSFEVK